MYTCVSVNSKCISPPSKKSSNCPSSASNLLPGPETILSPIRPCFGGGASWLGSFLSPSVFCFSPGASCPRLAASPGSFFSRSCFQSNTASFSAASLKLVPFSFLLEEFQRESAKYQLIPCAIFVNAWTLSDPRSSSSAYRFQSRNVAFGLGGGPFTSGIFE